MMVSRKLRWLVLSGILLGTCGLPGFSEAADAGNVEKAREYAKAANRALDKAASKGVIHPNQAANRKSAISARAAAL